MSDPDRALFELDRLRAKHARYARETRLMLAEQLAEIRRLRAELAKRGRPTEDEREAP